MSCPFLTAIEQWALRTLAKSPRIGFILVKEYGSTAVYAIKDISDPMQMSLSDAVDFEDEGYEDVEDCDEKEDIPAKLNRLYLAPDAER